MLIASILAGSITSLIVWFSCCSNPYNHIICQCFNPGLFSLSQEELAALEELSSAMKSGGVWVLSFFHGGMGMSGWPPSMWLLGWTVAKTIQEWKFGHHGCPFSWLPLQKNYSNYRSENCTNGTPPFRSKRHGWFMLLHCWQLMQVLRLLGSQGIVYLRLKTVSLQGQGFPPVKLNHEQISSILSISFHPQDYGANISQLD